MKASPVLNRKLVLETPERVPDGLGGWSRTWAELGQLWAEVKSGSGSERADEFLTVSSVPYRITVRAAPPGAMSRPKPEQRFREGSRIFRILAVAERDEHGRYLTCYAREEVSA
ncbi:head-tail adaptor protein [Vannielia litorea]|uniref:head-tail adaptor protein n=1 Tax=Vannielia TaxID=2813041 RepID=UPI001C938F42|nr:head-tail adaptor protein [Vannielia litorea]MBY6047516.1 head-tail adaptor protein [Vannielia litorea]MBY6074930.1 head-tail adaptor protein [Vannielia litorea]